MHGNKELNKDLFSDIAYRNCWLTCTCILRKETKSLENGNINHYIQLILIVGHMFSFATSLVFVCLLLFLFVCCCCCCCCCCCLVVVVVDVVVVVCLLLFVCLVIVAFVCFFSLLLLLFLGCGFFLVGGGGGGGLWTDLMDL